MSEGFYYSGCNLHPFRIPVNRFAAIIAESGCSAVILHCVYGGETLKGGYFLLDNMVLH
jgi:hypothetical protein